MNGSCADAGKSSFPLLWICFDPCGPGDECFPRGTVMGLGPSHTSDGHELNCALPHAFADDANHWLKDPYTQCRMFDANAKAGDHVGWLGECEGGLANG